MVETSVRGAWSWTQGAAVITGGGGLLGRGMARAFARRGMDVVLADLSVKAGMGMFGPVGAGAVADEVRSMGRRAIAVATDVTDPASVARLAETAYREFGRISLLCNNAGIARVGEVADLTLDDWNVVLDVHLKGVIHGLNAFLPRMIASGGPCHIVNTASMSGVGLAALRSNNAPYTTAKFAIVGLTEAVGPGLGKHNIGASVLCPGMTVHDPHAPREMKVASAAVYKDNLLGPDEVGEEVAHGVEENRLHIFPHRAGRYEVESRHALLMAGFDQAEATSPPLRTTS